MTNTPTILNIGIINISLCLVRTDSVTPALEGFSWRLFSIELNKSACSGRSDNHRGETCEKSKSSCYRPLVPTSEECHNSHSESNSPFYRVISTFDSLLCPLNYLMEGHIPSYPATQHLTLISCLDSIYIIIIRLYRV